MARLAAGLLAMLAVLGTALWWLQARVTAERPEPAPRVVTASEVKPRIDLVVEYVPPPPRRTPSRGPARAVRPELPRQDTKAPRPSVGGRAEPATAVAKPSRAPAVSEPAVSGRNAELVRRLMAVRDRMEAEP